MKKLLLLLLFAICAGGWQSGAIVDLLGLNKPPPKTRSFSIESLTVPADKNRPRGMSLTEYAELAKTDPDAYRKLFQSHEQAQERTEVDKLMNFFTRLKYE
ncbi:hypothetical protein BH11PSE11_BH11PSE11_34450 [soil metagenome]